MLLKNSSENSLRNVSKNVSKIFLSMLCLGENGIESAIQRGMFTFEIAV